MNLKGVNNDKISTYICVLELKYGAEKFVLRREIDRVGVNGS